MYNKYESCTLKAKLLSPARNKKGALFFVRQALVGVLAYTSTVVILK